MPLRAVQLRSAGSPDRSSASSIELMEGSSTEGAEAGRIMT
jgi:hypothetical protein